MGRNGIKVSVIIPIYKVEKYLQYCINSICSQTYYHLEILLIDDGSPDQCGMICDNNARGDSRIKVIHKKNEGLSSARNVGLNISTGEYVTFIDADDTVHPRFIEILLDLCEQYDCDIAQCDFLTVAENSRRLPLNAKKELEILNNRQALHKLCCERDGVKFAIACNKLYKRYLYEGIRYPVGKIHEDEFVTYRILWRAKKIAVTNQYLYYYLQRADSITGAEFSIKRLDILEALKERVSFLKEKELEEEYQCTLKTQLALIRNNYVLVKENIKDYKTICANLLKTEEMIISHFNKVENILDEKKVDYQKVAKDCSFQSNDKIVLYGAGYWGNIYYRWIRDHSKGKIVGWVDNFWYTYSCVECPVSPLDSLLSMRYDFILIAVKNKYMQEEIRRNLMSWGILKEKIRMICIDEEK